MSTAAVDPQTLPAGDEIEEAIDRAWGPRALTGGLLEKVHRDAQGRRLSHRYSRDIRAALAFLQTWFAPFLSDYYSFDRLDGEWTVTIDGGAWRKDDLTAVDRHQYEVEGTGDTLPLAICRAMLHIDREDEG